MTISGKSTEKHKRNAQMHKLGTFSGTLLEFDDGTVAYLGAASGRTAFRVRIADVTGFSVSKASKVTQQTLHVLGRGTVLASADVAPQVPRKIEDWFRSHPSFQADAEPGISEDSDSVPIDFVADELRKLADLRRDGLLTEEEFAAQKARLLGR